MIDNQKSSDKLRQLFEESLASEADTLELRNVLLAAIGAALELAVQEGQLDRETAEKLDIGFLVPAIAVASAHLKTRHLLN